MSFFVTDWQELSERISAPVKTVQTSVGLGTGKDNASFLEIPESLVLTALKKAEDSDKVIIRVYNPTKETVKGEFKCDFKNAKIVNLNEEYEAETDLKNVTVKPHQILTIEVEK